MKKMMVLLAVLGFAASAARAAAAKPAAGSAPASSTAKPAADAPAAAPKAEEPKGVILPIVAGRGVLTSASLAREYETTSKPQRWYNRMALVRSNRFDPNEDMSGTKPELRPPAPGKIYLILPFKLNDRKKLDPANTSVSSIGKYDYILRIGKSEFPCLAIAADDEAFDERTTEIRYTPAKPVVLMIFEIPVGTTKAEFVPRIPQMFPEDAKSEEFPVGVDTNEPKKGGR